LLVETQSVRHLVFLETLPVELRSGFEAVKLDPEWVWVYEHEGIKAVLICVPCHGVVHLLRISSTPDAPKTAVLTLLREARKECRERGFMGIIVFLESSTDTDMKLARIAQKFGLKGIPRIGFWCGGKL
jgi:hypothetical protein